MRIGTSRAGRNKRQGRPPIIEQRPSPPARRQRRIIAFQWDRLRRQALPVPTSEFALETAVFHRSRLNAIHRRKGMFLGVSAGPLAPCVPRAGHVRIRYRHGAALRRRMQSGSGTSGRATIPMPQSGFPRWEARRANTRPKMSRTRMPYDSVGTASCRTCKWIPHNPASVLSGALERAADCKAGNAFQGRSCEPWLSIGGGNRPCRSHTRDPYWTCVQRTMSRSTMPPSTFE